MAVCEDPDHDHAPDWADRAGIWLSVICLVHCAATPVALALLPTLAYGGDSLHVVLAVVLPVFALVAFVPGYREHRDKGVIFLGLLGVGLIFAALWAKPMAFEIGLTVSGSLSLVLAHWRNRRLKHEPHVHALQMPENSNL